MTDQELKDLVASLAIQSKETEAKWNKLSEERAIETAKTEAKWNRLSEERAETERMIKELSKQIDGISKTQGEITEDYFFNILKNKKEVSNLKFDDIDRNLKARISNNLKGEYDIVLFNGNSILVVEVKNKIREKDLYNLKEKQIKNFRELFPTYKDYKIYGAIAGFTIKDEIIEQAKDDGFFVLQKKGEMMVEEHDEIKSY
jgi:hypothetical protein